MTKPLPLAKQIIWVTRPEEAEGCRLRDALSRLGGTVISLPMVHTQIIHPAPTLPSGVEVSAFPQWLMFTSQVAVQAFVSHPDYAALLSPQIQQKSPKIAAVGLSTAQALESHGLTANLISPVADAGHLLQALLPQLQPGDRVLWPCGQLALHSLQQHFAASVDQFRLWLTPWVLYDTLPTQSLSADQHMLLKIHPADAVTFTSASAVKAFHRLGLSERLRPTTRLACLGASTFKAAQTLWGDFPYPMLQPQTQTLEALADCLLNEVPLQCPT